MTLAAAIAGTAAFFAAAAWITRQLDQEFHDLDHPES